MTLRIAIDTGGTFTDLLGFDQESRDLIVSKTPSTSSAPQEGVINALKASGVAPDALDLLLLGTTVATNALLERKGARVLYLTTAGFEDILFIQRVNRKHHYDLTWKKPDPLAARRDSIGVQARVDKDGNILVELSEAELARVVGLVRNRLDGATEAVAIAVNLLFSYTNPIHEERLRAALLAAFPHIPVSLSHQVAPIWREYERGSTTVADAYIKPIISRFVSTTEDELARWGYRGPLAIVKSNGGSMLSAVAKDHAVQVLLSGLAGGMIAGRFFGVQVGSENIISLDMGGTSTDVGTITDGEIGYTTEYQLEWGVPIAAPFMDLTTIGAGGGSLAWVDKGGFLRVGPQSAGAQPGPICYGRGGREPTVTDANLVLGRLNPEYFLGGAMPLDARRASARLAQFGATLSLSGEEFAASILALANENMANAIRLLTVQRGIDPREYDLVAFGGAGPLHASDIARSVGVRRIIIPPHPGLGSAFGALLADLRVDKVWTQGLRSDQVDAEQIDLELTRLAKEAVAELRYEGYTGEPLIKRSISMRYIGQNYEQDIRLPPGRFSNAAMVEMFESFHRQHEEFYGYRIGGEVIQLVHFNVSAIGILPKPALNPLPIRALPRHVGVREVYFTEAKDFVSCPVYLRNELGAGFSLTGPAIVEEDDSTTLVHAGQRLSVDEQGIMLLTV